jgi:hypothetical protein
MRVAVGKGFDAMRHRVDARGRRDSRRNRVGQFRVEHREVGDQVRAFDSDLCAGSRIGDERPDACLRARPGGRCDLSEARAPAGHPVRSSDILQRLLAIPHRRDQLGHVED